MANKEMKTLTFGNDTYKIVDEKAREEIHVVSEKADEALSLAKGATKAFVYDTYSDMIAELNALDKAELLVNFHVMIRTVCVPDLWISGVSDEHIEYTYTSNEDFIADLTEDGIVQVGYFILSALETQKVDLSEYVKNTDYAFNKVGVVKIQNVSSGLQVNPNSGEVSLSSAPNSVIDEKSNTYRPITPSNLDYAVKKALSDCKLTDEDAWTAEEQAAAIERIGLKDYIKYKYFNFQEAGVNVEGNPTYDEIKEAILSDVTPVLIHGHYIAYMTSGHWDAEAFEREELPGFTFVTHRSDMNNHWKIKYTEFWCTKQDDGSTLWAVGTHYLDAFIAEYNVTPAEAVIDAYEKGLEIIVKRSETPNQPAHYARLVRADGYGVTPNLTFTCEENKLSHHYHINVDGWHYWCYNLEDDLNVLNSKIVPLTNKIDSIGTYISGKDPLLSALSSMNAVDILKSVYSFRGGFCNNAGTLHIKNPGVYLIMQGGMGNKQITINYPTGKEFEATKWNGIILLAYESGVVTPIGIETSLTIAGAFKTPGTFQGWTTDGSYSTTINYPAKCVVAYLGNSNVDYLA